MEILTRAATAVRNGRRVRFEYRSHTDVASRREIEPYAVLHIDDRWYLIGNDVQRQAMRTFRLDRVQQLELCEANFERPPEFDAKQFLSERMPFLQSKYQIDVSIAMPFAKASEHFMLWRISIEPENDGTRLRCGRDQLEVLAAMLLSTGYRLVVHSPPELRGVFRKLAEDALRAAEFVARPSTSHGTE
jgi:predicted DNA-binding transcriptional regulator YafY